MRIPVKLLVLIAVVTGLGLFSLGADNTSAALNSFTTSAPSFVSGSSVTLTLLGTDDANGANPSLITMTASGATTPILTAITCNVGSPAATCVGGQPSPTSAASLVYDSTQFDSVNNTADSFTITVSLTATCISNATITVSVNQVISGGSSSQGPLTISCTASGSGGAGAGQIAINASPNALICGGTSTLTAESRDSVTGVLTPHVYHFQTDIGQILPQGDTSAILALLPGQLSATVTATTVAIPLNASLDSAGNPIPVVLTATIVIQNFCGDQIPTSPTQTYAISVIASPNVIPCGGTANITATARDQSGQIVPGVGFSFQSDVGGLVVGPPNTATSTAGTATLTLQPGMGKVANDYDAYGGGGVRQATVTASVGTKYATVIVQQYCPGVTTDGSTAPGKIVLVPSQNSISCNGNTFIGAVVKDSKGQVPANDTEVTFIATSGSFTSASGSTGSVTTTTTGAAATPTSGDTSGGTSTITTTTGQYIAKTTKSGALNVIYNAGPNSNGLVSITAAAGASFGTATIVVNCPTAITSGFGGGAAGGGLGSLRPPNTGEGGFQIHPPNTGDAGLAAESGSGSNKTIIAVALSIMAGALTSALAMRQRRS